MATFENTDSGRSIRSRLVVLGQPNTPGDSLKLEHAKHLRIWPTRGKPCPLNQPFWTRWYRWKKKVKETLVNVLLNRKPKCPPCWSATDDLKTNTHCQCVDLCVDLYCFTIPQSRSVGTWSGACHLRYNVFMRGNQSPGRNAFEY